MRTILKSFAALLVFASAALAQEDIAGTWAGKLAIAPDTNLEIHFALTRTAEGSYAAVLNSPDTGGIKNVAADSATFVDGKLTVAVGSLSGSYEGTLADGTFTGNWRQQGQLLPLELKPYEAPVLAQADKDRLLGQWVGTLSASGITVAIVYRFETNEAGEFVGFLDVPDQNASGIPLTDVQVAGNDVTFKAPLAQMQYAATLEGDRMVGSWTQGLSFPLTVTKGEYQAQVAALDLAAGAAQTLTGSWEGSLTMPSQPGAPEGAAPLSLRIVLRFATNAAGQFLGFISTPDRSPVETPITAAELTDGKLTLRVASIGGTYTGTLAGNTLTGEWIQTGMPSALPLILTKD